jgi:O-antigen ligase
MIGTDFKVMQIGRMLAAASALHLLLCVVFFVTARHYLFSPEDPFALKGLTTHKNIFGLEQGLALISFAFCPFQRLKFLRWPLVALAAVGLVWSHSSGSFIATAAALAISPFLLVSKLGTRERVPVTAIAAVGLSGILAVVMLNLERIPELFSKDSTLTGRTELWSLVLIAIRNHPWFGYGFDSFWRGLEGDSLAVIRGVGWLVPTAHNGYLDILLGIGIAGAVLFALFLLQFFGRSLSHALTGEGSSRYFPLVFLTLLLVYNLNESALLTRSGLPFLLLVALTSAMATQRVKQPMRARCRNTAMVAPLRYVPHTD